MTIQTHRITVPVLIAAVLALSGCGSGSSLSGKLAGSWHLKQEQVSGKLQEPDEKEAYTFNADGSYTHTLDKEKDGKNVKTDSGKWELKDGSLVLTKQDGKPHPHTISIADGQFTLDTGVDEKQIYARD